MDLSELLEWYERFKIIGDGPSRECFVTAQLLCAQGARWEEAYHDPWETQDDRIERQEREARTEAEKLG
jgi:hypothetical protein